MHGIGNVNKWIENNTIKSDGSDIENIPYKETRNYVRKVERDYRIYQQIAE
jgi:soluble lytic murein transglycosylase